MIYRLAVLFTAVLAVGWLSCSQTTKTKKNKTIASFSSLKVDTLWTDKVEKSAEEWQQILTPSQFRILRLAGTERAFTHEFNKNKKEGIYVCAGCKNPLFSSQTKYNSGTGWPSFYAPYFSRSVSIKRDYSLGMAREEVVCTRCGGHVGHVFNDGPRPTALRYCMNGEAMEFIENKKDTIETAYFALGCFWCVEEIYEEVRGVQEVISGYAGGTENNPNYKSVGKGKTNHAEAIEVQYNPDKISFKDLLRVYFYSGDITQVNGQGPDIGKQYRSILFYKTDEQKALIENSIDSLNNSGEYDKPLSIEVQEFKKFFPAEDYHQDFVKRNPNQAYVRAVSIPRFKKAVANFEDLLKEE